MTGQTKVREIVLNTLRAGVPGSTALIDLVKITNTIPYI
jgi:hypothetical protein